MKLNKGITLISLIVTILVLIILAIVSISILVGENGILTKAKIARENSDKAQVKENSTIDELNSIIDQRIGATTRGDANIKMVTLFESSTGATSGNLTDTITNYDILTVIHGTAISGKDTLGSVTLDANLMSTIKATFNFATGSSSIYGSFNFTGNTFSRAVNYDNGSWSSRYLLYKVIGTKYL